MSKSPNLFLPAAGGTALALGLAYGVATNHYADDKVRMMERQVELAQTQASEAENAAAAEAERLAVIEEEAQAIQNEARLALASAGSINLTAPAPAAQTGYGLGRTALAEEIAAWDVDVLPDGRGLPEGSGNAYDGEEIFAEKCGACHGDFAEGVDNWPVLAGGFDTLADEDPVKTVGSYWPHLSTAYDYIYRSMPFGQAGTLTPDETYAIVAYILYSNDLIEDDYELTHENLASFEMYNRDGFIIDDREALEYSQWRTEPCMEDCKDTVDVTMRTVFLVDTPAEGGSESLVNPARDVELPSFTREGPSFIPEAAPAAVVVEETAAAPVDDAAALLATGEKVFKKCAACHQIGEGAKNGVGPPLNALMGRTIGSVEKFKYSKTFLTALEQGETWNTDNLTAFLANPKAAMKGTKMAFAGLKKPEEIAALLAYLEDVGG